MQYNPIEPINQPELLDQVLGVRRRDQIVGNIDFLDEVESVICTNVDAPYGVKLALIRAHTFYRLAENPIKLRHNGETIDFELYCDCYNYVQEEQHYIKEEEDYPLVEVFDREWGEGSYYRKDTTCYVFEGLGVQVRSSYVWDGRHSIAVNKEGKVVNEGSRIGSVQEVARQVIKQPLVPKYTFALGNEGITRQPRDYPPTINVDRYEIAIQSFLDLHYNANSIPPVPLTTVELNAIEEKYSGSALKNNEELVSLVEVAALLDGDYFVEWVAYRKYSKRIINLDA